MLFITNVTKIKWYKKCQNERTENDMLSKYEYSNDNSRKIIFQVTTTKQYKGECTWVKVTIYRKVK